MFEQFSARIVDYLKFTAQIKNKIENILDV